MLFLKCLCRGDQVVHLDVNALLATFENDEKFVIDLVKTGINDFESACESIKSALRSRDREQIFIGAHSLKGSASNLCCHTLTSASADLEVHARSFDWSVVKQKVKLVLEEVDRVKDAAASIK